MPAAIVGYTPPTVLSRGGYTTTWIPAAGTQMRFVIGASNPRTHDSVFVICEVPDDGSFTVPPSTFALIPPAMDHGSVIAMRVVQTFVGAGDAHVVVEALDVITSAPLEIAPLAPPKPASITAAAPVVDTHTGARLKSYLAATRYYLTFGWGMGGFSRNGATPPYAGFGFRAGFGHRIGSGLYVTENLAALPDSGSESHMLFDVGVKWMPFEPRRNLGMFGIPIDRGPQLLLGSTYLVATLGADVRDRANETTMVEEIAGSPLVGLGIGAFLLEAAGWAIGGEFREQLAYFDSHLQRGWFGVALVQLGW
jgi:hypothetical protein